MFNICDTLITGKKIVDPKILGKCVVDMWYNNISNAESSSLNLYCSDGYYNINQASVQIYDGVNTQLKDSVENLSGLIKRHKTPMDLWYSRGSVSEQEYLVQRGSRLIFKGFNELLRTEFDIKNGYLGIPVFELLCYLFILLVVPMFSFSTQINIRGKGFSNGFKTFLSKSSIFLFNNLKNDITFIST